MRLAASVTLRGLSGTAGVDPDAVQIRAVKGIEISISGE
jgi:hypothetical protein